MYQIILSLAVILTLSLSASVRAETGEQAATTELQGYGAFSHLNKDWMLMALYSKTQKNGQQLVPTSAVEESNVFNIHSVQRLEIKIATEKFSNRRFRSLWLEALSIEHGAGKIVAMEKDLKTFFDVFQGPLIEGDTLIIERTSSGTEIRINYHQLAAVSDDFLPLVVQSLVGKHPPTQALKSGLLGEDSLRDQMNLSIRFERLEPTLPRISEVSRWGKSAKRILASK